MQGGDVNVTPDFYFAYRGLVEAICKTRFGKTSTTWKDAFQESWIHLASATHPTQGAFPGWVRGVVLNACRSHARTQRRQEMKWQPSALRVRFHDFDEPVLTADHGEDLVLHETLSDGNRLVDALERAIDFKTFRTIGERILPPVMFAACFAPHMVASKNTRSTYRRFGAARIRRHLSKRTHRQGANT